jgi:hypothetical protein
MTKIINYCVTEALDSFSSVHPASIFSLEDIGFDLEPSLNSIDNNQPYSKCPAWTHKAKRTFLAKSVYDIEFSIDKKKQFPVVSKKMPEGILHENMCFFENQTIIQFTAPVFVFWTDHKNIWIESRPHPLTALNNNFIGFSGWWNISRWNRPINFSVEVINENLPVTIKRGDPIFEICFYSNNLNDDIKLVRQDSIPDKVHRRIGQNLNVKRIFPNISNKFIFNSTKSESKCPFKKMFLR